MALAPFHAFPTTNTPQQAAQPQQQLTVADIMMAGELRALRKTDLMQPFPRVESDFERCLARPAWQRTLGLYASRLG